MKLTKRSDAVSKDEKQLGVSRRTFMRNTTLATAGSVAAAGMFAPGMMKKASAKAVDSSKPVEQKRTICSHCSVAVVCMPKCKMVSGSTRNPLLTTHSMLVVTVPRVQRCANTATVSVA